MAAFYFSGPLIRGFSICHKSLFLILLLGAFPTGTRGQALQQGSPIGVSAVAPRQDFVYQSGRSYDNRAFEDWLYPDVLSRGPYRNYYGPLGDYVFRSFDVFSWREIRSTEHRGEQLGSQLDRTGNY